jgi:ADP-ribosylglycohydrolase
VAHDKNKELGTLLGVAYGDALGFPGEFVRTQKVLQVEVNSVLRSLNTGRQAARKWYDPATAVMVSDDTQMTLAVGKALMCDGTSPTAPLGTRLEREFVKWSRSPQNNRSPGITCMAACHRMTWVPWQLATDLTSKGNGANMRVAPAGLLNVSPDVVADIAQLQAAVTHAHPTALAASEITALAIWYLKRDMPPDRLMGNLLHRAEEQQSIYREHALGKLWRRTSTRRGAHALPVWQSPEQFISFGWQETHGALLTTQRRSAVPATTWDICAELRMGGWTAEEALALALTVFLRDYERPVAALSNAAITSGDSDSIASIVGALLGAYHGVDGFPPAWAKHIEYGKQIQRLASQLREW